MVPHDYSRAHEAFIEATLGLNAAFSGYQDFNRYITEHVKAKIEELVALAKAIEPPDSIEAARQLQAAVTDLEKLRERHIHIHRGFYRPCLIGASLCAVFSLAAIYADWAESVGWWCGLLVLPIPTYLSLVWKNYRTFRKLAYQRIDALPQSQRTASQRPPPPPPPLPPPTDSTPPGPPAKIPLVPAVPVASASTANGDGAQSRGQERNAP